MRRILLSLLLVASWGQAIKAQKFGYIDSEYILNKMPGYAEAQSEMDRISLSWQKEIEKMQQEVTLLYNTFEQEKILLTEEMRQERLKQIHAKESEVMAYQKKVFGFKGLFFLKKQELMEPLQDRIFESVRKVAKSKRLAIIFDKAGELVMMYTDPMYDYTDFVLEELGLGDSDDTIQ